MTTYNAAAVNDATIAFQKPITLQQGRALRDNTLAIAEADATVPLNLLPTVLLGTINTTAGSSIALTGLVLTPFRFVRCTIHGVSFNAGSRELFIQGRAVTALSGVASDAFHGSALIDLFDGSIQATTGIYVAGSASAVASSYVATTSTTQASTSITASTSGTFDAGYIRVYGLK